MRSTSGAAADYANDRPQRDAAIVARLRAAGGFTPRQTWANNAAGDRGEGGPTGGGNDAGTRWNAPLMGCNTSAGRGGLICW